MVAAIKIWDELVGAVLWDDARKVAVFEYDKGFLKKEIDLAPLTMPIAGTRHVHSFTSLPKETYKGLPGMLADSLPDRFGNNIIDTWLSRQGKDRSQFTAVDRLCYVGRRGMGALEYEPTNHPLDGTSKSIEIEALTKLAISVLDQRQQISANISEDDHALQEIIRVGTSAGGARAKAVLAIHPKTGEVRSGQVDAQAGFEHWLLKFDGVTNKELGDPAGYGQIEYAYYLMAKACGIEMMPSKVYKESGRTHFLTQRFDRLDGSKIHMQTLCGLAHYDYNDPVSYSYEQLFEVMRRLRLPYNQAEEMYRRMLFNVIARNQDDHTKNFGFLYDLEEGWRLSPAYDLTYAYNPTNIWLKQHQLSINGKRDQFTEKDLLDFGGEMNIKSRKEILEEVKTGINRWGQFAVDAEISEDKAKVLFRTFRLDMPKS